MVGAIFSGVSAVIAVLLVVRKTMNLQYFLRAEHFDALAKLVLIFSFAWTYFFFNDYLVEWYGGDWVGHQLLLFQARGPMAPLWYAMLFFNIVIPWLTLWNKRVRRSPIALFLITIGINIGMYLERFIIVPGFLQRNRLPFDWGYYNPRGLEDLHPAGHPGVLLPALHPGLAGHPADPGVGGAGRAVEPHPAPDRQDRGDLDRRAGIGGGPYGKEDCPHGLVHRCHEDGRGARWAPARGSPRRRHEHHAGRAVHVEDAGPPQDPRADPLGHHPRRADGPDGRALPDVRHAMAVPDPGRRPAVRQPSPGHRPDLRADDAGA